MHFRTKRSPSGTILQLVQSYRNSVGQPRHRVILSLGNASISKSDWTPIAKAVESAYYGQDDLFLTKKPKRVQRWVDAILKRIARKQRQSPIVLSNRTHSAEPPAVEQEPVLNGVLVNRIKHTHTTTLGPILLAKHAWDNLRLSETLHRLGFNNAQVAAAQVSVINRLVCPLSENQLSEWVMETALPELLGNTVEQSSKDRYYRVSDKLLEEKDRIEAHIRSLQRDLFHLERTVFLYDLTNSHFEGTGVRNPKAKRGKNKQKRNDCPQIVIGMIFDGDGFEVGHKVFDGNMSDSKSLVEMVDELRTLMGERDLLSVRRPPIVVMDAGLATKANLKQLREEKMTYVINDSRRGRGRYRTQFADGKFEAISGRKEKKKVFVCQIDDPHSDTDGTAKKSEENVGVDAPCGDKNETKADRLLLCKSAERQKKEQAMLSSAETRFLQDVKKLSLRIEHGRLTDDVKINRAIGRVQANHPRVKRYYELLYAPGSPRENATDVEKVRGTLTWTRKHSIGEDEALLGCYVLRTNCQDFSSDEFWKLYMALTCAEDGFHALKADLGLRPNRHYVEDRVDAHVNITVIAYSLLRTILYRLEQCGDVREWSTIRRVLETHCYTTIEIPTSDGGVHRIRRAGEPELCQKDIYRNLGVEWRGLPVMTLDVGGCAAQ